MGLSLYVAAAMAGVAALVFCSQQPAFVDFQIPFRTDETSLESTTNSTWDILYHLGGNGPWIPKIDGIESSGIDVPTGCRTEQIHMISRHGERFPTVLSGIRMLELYQRIKHSNVTLQGDLAWVNDWEFITTDPSKHFEALVSTGSYAGTLQSFSTGVKLRTRYKHLLDGALARRMKTSFWAGDSRRVIDTAKYFAAGFFSIDWQDVATLSIIPETADVAADTLTPGKTCLNYANNADDFGHDYGARMLFEFRQHYLPPIIQRLAKENSDIIFTENEVYSMQELCGFETLAKGSSKWCNVFTRDELESFEYARDLLHYYKSGPGNPYAPTMGHLWLNATADLLREGPSAGPLFFSFVHDGDINPLITTLQLLPQQPALPTSHVLPERTWRISDIVPMGGRLIFERLACVAAQTCYANALYPNHVYCEEAEEEVFVRLNVNDGIVGLPNCTSGPGSSCPLPKFLEMVQERGRAVGMFGDICGLDDSAAKQISFLHQ